MMSPNVERVEMSTGALVIEWKPQHSMGFSVDSEVKSVTSKASVIKKIE